MHESTQNQDLQHAHEQDPSPVKHGSFDIRIAEKLMVINYADFAIVKPFGKASAPAQTNA